MLYQCFCRAGLPTTVASGGTSRVTTAPAPITALLPRVTPGKTPPCHLERFQANTGSREENATKHKKILERHRGSAIAR
jgi:hypothetical protein